MANVPQLRNSIVLEPKNMDRGAAAVLRMLTNVRMYDDVVSVFERAFHIQHCRKLVAASLCD